MTDKTPERIWVSEIPWDLGKSGALDALGFAWSIAHGKNPTEFVRADIHAAVVAERDNAIDRADATERAFGELASKVPLPDVIRATGTVGDFAAWFCEVVAERDQLREQVERLRNELRTFPHGLDLGDHIRWRTKALENPHG